MRHGLGNSQNNRRVHGDANLPVPLFCLSRLTAMYDNDVSSTEDGVPKRCWRPLQTLVLLHLREMNRDSRTSQTTAQTA